MRGLPDWRGAVAVLAVTVPVWGQSQISPAPVASPATVPAPAPTNAVATTAPAVPDGPVSSPVCQWGDCAWRCNAICEVGYVCGISGECIRIKTPAQVAEQQEAERDVVVSQEQRQRARYWTRLALGGGAGLAKMQASSFEAQMFFANLGVRQQLSAEFGLHVQAICNVASTNASIAEQSTAGDSSKHLSLTELGGSLSPYFGPLGRFYIGPALLAGYRWYSAPQVARFPSPLVLHNGLFYEAGLRMGLLAGREEQFDITALLTTSFDEDTRPRGLFGFSYEFR